jgi:hypothetical protein
MIADCSSSHISARPITDDHRMNQIYSAHKLAKIVTYFTDAATAGGNYSDGDGVNSPENFLSSIAGIVKIKESNPTMLLNGHAKFQRS